MSDIAPVADPAAPAVDPVVDPTATAAPPAVDPAAPPAAPAELAGLEALPESWQKHIRELRDESANGRTSFKPFKEAFDGWDEGDREIMLSLARELGSSETRAQGAERMKAIAESLLAEGEPAAPATPKDPSAPLTPEDVQKMLDERDTAQKGKEAEENVKKQAEGLGYAFGTRTYYNLLWEAVNNHKGDLEAAHTALEAEGAEKIEKYLEQKRQEAEGTPTVGNGGAPPANSTAPTTWKEARKSAEARASQLK